MILKKKGKDFKDLLRKVKITTAELLWKVGF